MEDDRNKLTKAVMSIIRTADIINRVLEFELGKYGSSPARFSVMNALFVHDGIMTPSNISKWTFRAKHSITSMLKVLENIGYVKREINVNDHRSVNIFVTEKGKTATNVMIQNAEEISRRIISCLDKKQIEILTGMLKQIRREMLKRLNSSMSDINVKNDRSTNYMEKD